jgi:hypothetical protein
MPRQRAASFCTQRFSARALRISSRSWTSRWFGDLDELPGGSSHFRNMHRGQTDQVFFFENDRPFYGVAELTDIAGPVIPLDHGQHFGCKPLMLRFFNEAVDFSRSFIAMGARQRGRSLSGGRCTGRTLIR